MPVEDPGKGWILHSGGRKFGPLSEDELRGYFRAGMVKSVDIAPSGEVSVAVYLTVAGCPLKAEIQRRVSEALAPLPGVTGVQVGLDTMSDDEHSFLRLAEKNLIRRHPGFAHRNLRHVDRHARDEVGVGNERFDGLYELPGEGAALRRAGAARVEAVTFARAEPPVTLA